MTRQPRICWEFTFLHLLAFDSMKLGFPFNLRSRRTNKLGSSLVGYCCLFLCLESSRPQYPESYPRLHSDELGLGDEGEQPVSKLRLQSPEDAEVRGVLVLRLGEGGPEPEGEAKEEFGEQVWLFL